MPFLARLPGTRLLTVDGVRLSARHDARVVSGAAGDADRGLAFVVAHGFTGSWRRPDVQAVVAGLRPSGGVISFDFRGHGESGGLSTVGDLEIQDLDAAVAWARELGYARVATVGWSMGAAVAIRQAGLLGGVDAVVAVSGPSRWHFRGTPAMRLVHRAIESRTGRAVTAGVYGTRIAPSRWDPPPYPPDAVVARIAPAPLLVVHGDADRFFPPDHARWLVAAAREPSELWLEPGFGHAETAASPDLVRRIARWAEAAAATATAMAGTGAGGSGAGVGESGVTAVEGGCSARMRR